MVTVHNMQSMLCFMLCVYCCRPVGLVAGLTGQDRKVSCRRWLPFHFTSGCHCRLHPVVTLSPASWSDCRLLLSAHYQRSKQLTKFSQYVVALSTRCAAVRSASVAYTAVKEVTQSFCTASSHSSTGSVARSRAFHSSRVLSPRLSHLSAATGRLRHCTLATRLDGNAPSTRYRPRSRLQKRCAADDISPSVNSVVNSGHSFFNF